MPSKTNSFGEYRKKLLERFEKTKLESFSDSEITELLLSFIVSGREVRRISKKLLHDFKCFRGVFDAVQNQLEAVEGMKRESVIFIKLLKEILGFYLKERVVQQNIVNSKRDVLDFLALHIGGERVEKFMAIYLNSKNMVLGMESLQEGSIDKITIYPRTIIEKALKQNARSLVFVHNHPSGDITPSKADWHLTELLRHALSVVDVALHDHLIIGKNSYYSFSENGWAEENFVKLKAPQANED